MFRFKSTVSSVGKVGIQGSFLLSLRRAAWWGRGGYFGSKSTMAGKAWQPEREAAGYAAFATGNRRVTKARAQLTLSYLCRRPWLMEWDSPYLERVFPLQLAKQTFPHK